MPLLLDTGILYALADEDDDWHARSRDYLAASKEVLMAPVTVLPEVSYLLRARLGPKAERLFVRSLSAGELAVQQVTLEDLRRSERLMEQYVAIGFVDATVIAIAERLQLRRIATSDRRHFSAVRPRHVDAFELVP